MKVGQKIKALRKEKGLTQQDLAKILKLAPTAVSAWERDANKPMMDKIAVMSELFGVPVTHFFDVGENPISIVSEPSNIYKVSPRTVRIPVLGEIACGDPILVEENYENYRDELVESLPAGNLVYLQAKGDSMAPTIPHGSFVLIREQVDVENGEIAAVLVNGNTEATLKRVKKQGDVIILMPDNSAHEPILIDKNNPAKIIGKAIRFTQDL
ncbi:LexA family transcriptional regulator [Psychrobacillus sp. FJAT-21963]|uniref:LexA family protein n=1 Tax=Psychrobacillus sp. FJAT-21963 TaxID=1712028 RepID=UPI0006FC1D60|nr:XRE family transcriptional regulator [Psychrobacillus sp. FJAT-21963]KQL37164.1 XRE family transcriptional regulator [Psychrobacillus sp. FJAT-21963]